MGSTISGDTAPFFFVKAEQDPGVEGKPGLPLQQIQIVKVWRDASGAHQEQTFTVAGSAQSDAAVDTGSCLTSGSGAESLCAVWQDPGYDTTESALYYARVLENPSCRWSTRQCANFAPSERPARCDDGSVPETVQQRAWSSPIWVRPS